MSILATASLIAAGVGALGGAIGGAANRARARDAKNGYYDYAEDLLDSQYYRDPLTTVGNRSLIKAAKENHQDNLEAIENRAVAGGATMENQLAARQANNESLDKLYGQLLQGEDARRDNINRQKLGLAGQRANDEANSYLQAAQDWQSWGAAMGNAALSFGSSQLLGGGELSAEQWAKNAPDVSGLMNDMANAEIYGVIPPKHPGKTGVVGLAGGKKNGLTTV